MTQNNCKLIGITGGISTGKSTVSDIIKKMGYPLIDADKIAREATEIGKPAYNKVIEKFGEKIVKADKTIDRQLLGSIIFNDKEAREDLNKITHPYIFLAIKEETEEKCKENLIIFLDIPLLFEQYEMLKAYEISFDEIWLVYTDRDTQISRLMKRDNIIKEEALKKINSQMSIEGKRSKSSKIIDNRSSIEDLEEQLIILIKALESLEG